MLQGREGQGSAAGAGMTQGAGLREAHSDNSVQLPALLCWGQADF